MIRDPLEIRHVHLAITDSTQEYIKRELSHIDPNVLFCVTADEQTAGRGQRGKSWLSLPNRNVYLSMHFFGPILINLAQLVSVSAMKVLMNNGVSPLFKWPNDILVSGKKIAGALGEIVDSKHAIMGIGINVLMTAEEATQIDQKATSLLIETGVAFDIHAIAQAVMEQFQKDLQLLLEQGFAPFLPMINERLAYKGESVNVGSKSGTVVKVNLDGSLQLRKANGETAICFNGSLTPLVDL